MIIGNYNLKKICIYLSLNASKINFFLLIYIWAIINEEKSLKNANKSSSFYLRDFVFDLAQFIYFILEANILVLKSQTVLKQSAFKISNQIIFFHYFIERINVIIKIIHQMMQQTQVSNCSSPKRFYIKRQLLKDKSILLGSSMFEGFSTKPIDMATIDDLKKFQTLTTAIDNTTTLNNEEQISVMEKSQREEKRQFLPKINLTLEAKLGKDSKQIKSQPLRKRQKMYSIHNSDPLYLKLQQTAPKRVNKKYNQYKREWVDACLRRKQKSVIERSFDKSAATIDHINLDAKKRKNTTELSEMLRNNIDQKVFIFPGKLKPEIEGLKGKGGKVIPFFSELFMAQQVYKYNKKKSLLSE